MNLNPFVNLLVMLLDLYEIALIIYIVIGWLVYFEILNRGQPFVAKVYEVLHKLLEPVMVYIRKIIPPISGIDLSPIFFFILLYFLKDVLITYFRY